MGSKIHWSRRKYTREEFTEAWLSSNTIAECARKLNLTIYGSTYSTLKSTALMLDLSKSHMIGRAWARGKTFSGRVTKRRVPLENLLIAGSYRASSSLKPRLIQEGILENRCYAPFCPLPNPSIDPFTGEACELKLALDHVNGINTDNRVENLRLLCYHCHGMTDTWCRGAVKLNKRLPKASQLVCECGAKKSSKARRCQTCHLSSLVRSKARPKTLKISWPTLQELERMVKESSFSEVGRRLGVSDNAVRKAIKRMSLLHK